MSGRIIPSIVRREDKVQCIVECLECSAGAVEWFLQVFIDLPLKTKVKSTEVTVFNGKETIGAEFLLFSSDHKDILSATLPRSPSSLT